MEIDIKINIRGGQNQEPKEIKILNSNLVMVKDIWITSRQYSITLPKDIYNVRLSMASGEYYDCIAVSNKHKRAVVNFDLRNASDLNEEHDSVRRLDEKPALTPEEKLLAAIFGDKAVKLFPQGSVRIAGTTVARLWTKNNGIWTSRLLPEVTQEQLSRGEYTFNIKTADKFHILELQNPNKISQFISVPASPAVKCIIKKSSNQMQSSFYDVTLRLKNKHAQGLLSLMNSGDMSRASSLWRLDNAEDLLQEKIKDPIGAAIGGYYLLKLGELGRMHHWARNLAEWFPWLPDGDIIYAWQLILQYNQIQDEIDDAYVSSRIRQSLLRAMDRGMPVFTEGARLLYEGLTMCYYKYNEEDKDVEEALKSVRVFLSNLDGSKETTTYLGQYPDLPDNLPFENFQFPTLFSQSLLASENDKIIFSIPQNIKQPN